MPKNDEGEFELVLGNKQLLSVFFIVVLLGVFFTMGYIVGRNTAGGALEVAQAPGQPLVVDSDTARPASAPAAAPAAAAPKPPASRPAPEPPKQQPVAAPKQVAAPPVRSTPAPKPKPTPPPPPPSGGVSMPASGQVFLQVAATSSPEGAVLRDVLLKRGFKATLAPVPGQDLVRVLVGPLADSQDIAQTRDKLQGAGFKPFTRKY